MTIKACADALCTTVITDDVDITLSPATGWANNPVTITNGQATLDLNHTTPGNIVLDITASTITPASPKTCFGDNVADLSCTLVVSDTGFIFDVPTLTACKPSAEVTIKAVKTGSTTGQCVSALTGDKTLSFWSDYDIPATGQNKVNINGTDIATSNAGTNINLTFDINGKAQFTAQYDDAGRIKLNAKYEDISTGLVLEGSDPFVSKPVMLVSYSSDSSADCASQDASCSRFKKAGETFDLKINAACWEDDADTDFTDNPTTPNFELASIGFNHSVIAPAGSFDGQLGQSSVNFSTSDGGSKTITKSVSEVGVFSFNLTEPECFGETVATSSEPIGRFYPDHFETTTANEGSFGKNACTGFSYSGQTFNYLTKPQLLVTAFSANSPATVTQNYKGDFAKLADTDFTVTEPSTDANQLGADNTNLVRLDWLAVVPSLTDNSDGSLTYAFGDDIYTYLHQANSQIAPFNNAVDLVFTRIRDSDDVSATTLPYTLTTAGEEIRFGRIALDSAHGSELAALTVGLRTEFFNGSDWLPNTQDQCTSLILANHIQLTTVKDGSKAGDTIMYIEIGPTRATLANPIISGSGSLSLSPPGEDNQGYVDIQSNINATHPWLLDLNNGEAQGRASFGLFRGSDNIIFRRERF